GSQNPRLGNRAAPLRRGKGPSLQRDLDFGTLWDIVPDASVYRLITRPGGPTYFEYVSPGFQSLFELRGDVVLNDASPLYGLLHPDDRDPAMTAQAHAAEALAPFKHECRFILPSGKTRWIRWHSMPERLSDGTVAWNGIALDITERKQAEEETRAAETRYQNLFDSMVNGFALHEIILDEAGAPCDYRYLEANPAFERLTGLCVKDIIGRRILEIAPQTERHWIDTFGRVATTGEVVHFENYWSVRQAYYEVIAYRPAPGQFACVFTDVTERKRAEEAVREAAIRWQTTFNAMESAVWLLDKDMRIVVANDATLRVFGKNPRGVVGHHCWEIVHGTKEPIAGCPVVRSQRTRRRESMELQAGGKWYEVTADPVAGDAGALLGFVHVVSDITERKKLEADRLEFETRMQQTQRLESLGVMAGGIAHDFNNILMAIMGHAELALADISPLSPGRESLAEVVSASKRAADLCGQMLAYAGRSRIDKSELDLGALVEETLHLLKTSISKKAILNLNLEKSLPFINGDPAQIRQILMNLVINASDAIGERGGVITISAGAMDCSEEYLAGGCIVGPGKPGTYVYIEVSDTGCGMDRKTVQRIFEPFFTTKFAGRGLGLSAVMGIVKAHDGALRIYSEPGKGSTFRVLFPAIDVAGEGELEGDVVGAWCGSGTVLLVDDDESIRVIGSKQLRRLGLEVVTAEDGRRGVDIY
ncbi:MAG: PAS domain S-box protein, partial [Planctomycetes bacterium]|nr:PAS domain S-box protein [Planctomycetota bacterium]